jgi:hypothetical protein
MWMMGARIHSTGSFLRACDRPAWLAYRMSKPDHTAAPIRSSSSTAPIRRSSLMELGSVESLTLGSAHLPHPEGGPPPYDRELLNLGFDIASKQCI